LTRDIYRLVSRLAKDNLYSVEKLITGFCLLRDIKDIYTYNFKSLLTWCCYVKTLGQCSAEETEHIDGLYQEFVEELQKEHVEMPPGYCSHTDHVKPNLENIWHIHRPLCLYAVFYLLEHYVEVFFLREWGFTKHTIGRGSFWIREQSERPCVFLIHGICRGWSYYRDLIQAIYKNYTVVLLDYECIKINSFDFHVPQPDEYSNQFAYIVERFRLRDITLIGNSYGTFLCGWILRNHADKIRKVIFVDPLCFTVGLYETAYYIFYKKPRLFSDYVFKFFVTYNVQIASILQRKFAWYNHVLRLDKIPAHIQSVICISEKDAIYNVPALTEEIAQYQKLQSENACTMVMWKNIHHGEYMYHTKCLGDIVSHLPI